MGFGCQFEIGLSDGRVAESRESGVGIVETSQKEENQKGDKKAVSGRRGHEYMGVPKHILGSRLIDGLGRIEVHAC
jgi:hypothetical protein